METYEAARAVLRKHFGYDDFRPGQRDAVRSILSGRDTLVLIPTGGGKSLCYQIPAQILPGPTLVISPLISLMKDQVDNACRAGLHATFVNSTISPQEVNRRIETVRSGTVKLLYMAPERADNPRFLVILKSLSIAMLAIDEAHCISQWGHEFRPSYMRLGVLREALRCRVIALTATATPEVRRDIVTQLRMHNPKVLASGFDRPNLKWHVLAAETQPAKDALLLRLLREREQNGPALVFAATRKRVDALSDFLNARSIRASGYHAGASSEERSRLQEMFMAEQAGIVIATNAFGMGIDKANVRLVVHYDMPGSLEAYYQEAGRAGRDGRDSNCVLLHGYRDRFTHEFMIDQAHPADDVVRRVLAAAQQSGNAGDLAKRCQLNRRIIDSALRILCECAVLQIDRRSGALRVIRRTLQSSELQRARNARQRELLRLKRMQAYAYYHGCRRKFVLQYFGQAAAALRCAGCDNCQDSAFLAGARKPRSRFRTPALFTLFLPAASEGGR